MACTSCNADSAHTYITYLLVKSIYVCYVSACIACVIVSSVLACTYVRTCVSAERGTMDSSAGSNWQRCTRACSRSCL